MLLLPFDADPSSCWDPSPMRFSPRCDYCLWQFMSDAMLHYDPRAPVRLSGPMDIGQLNRYGGWWDPGLCSELFLRTRSFACIRGHRGRRGTRLTGSQPESFLRVMPRSMQTAGNVYHQPLAISFLPSVHWAHRSPFRPIRCVAAAIFRGRGGS